MSVDGVHFNPTSQHKIESIFGGENNANQEPSLFSKIGDELGEVMDAIGDFFGSDNNNNSTNCNWNVDEDKASRLSKVFRGED